MSFIRYYSQPIHINDRDFHELSDYYQRVDQSVKHKQLADVTKKSFIEETKKSLESEICHITNFFRDKKNIKLEKPRIMYSVDLKDVCIVLSNSDDTYLFSGTRKMVEEHFGCKYKADEIILCDPNDLNDVHVHGC